MTEFKHSNKLKEELRTHFKFICKNLEKFRKKEAREQVYKVLVPQLNEYKFVLSFYSLPSEIDLSILNQELIFQKKLALPRIEGDEIRYYFVNSLEQLELKDSYFFQPPSHSDLVAIDNSCILLVPGLAFDDQNYRLGYGKGHFDRFLAKNHQLFSIGIGYKEQSSAIPLSIYPHDLPVSVVHLF